MKFGKLLQSRAEELQSTGLTEHFLRYKALKKTLKQISKEDHQGEQQHNGEEESEPAAGESLCRYRNHNAHALFFMSQLWYFPRA